LRNVTVKKKGSLGAILFENAFSKVLQLFFTTFYTILCRCTITRQLIVIKTPEIAKKSSEGQFLPHS
jgi:hypothetical protein